MTRTLKLTLFVVCLIGGGSGAFAQAVIYESADYVAPDGSYSSWSVSSSFWQGVAFTTDVPYRVTSLGGHIRGDISGNSLFVAVFATSGGLPPSPPNTDDALFVELVTPSASPTDYSLDTDFVLPPGDWALVFGSGMAGATGSGSMPAVNTQVGSPIFITNVHGIWSQVTGRAIRFFINGIEMICGDEVVDEPEICDDGELNGVYGFCNEDCTGPGPHCGDDEVQTPEETCDDGIANGTPGGCNSSCSGLEAACGDGEVQVPEECDDGDNNGDYGFCNAQCTARGAYCGDGLAQGPEQCDDGNASNRDSCLNGCINAICGDGFVQQDTEECDDANNNNSDGCTNLCAEPEGTDPRSLDPEPTASGGCEINEAPRSRAFPVVLLVVSFVFVCHARRRARLPAELCTKRGELLRRWNSRGWHGRDEVCS